MRFPARLKPDTNGSINVSFPDIPEALTFGKTEADALTHAADALETALDFYFEDGRPVPAPSGLKRGQRWVDLAPAVSATVLLHNELLAQDVGPAELARRMGIPKQEMTRILDLRHATKIDTIGAALAALGKRLELQVL